jgi:hypothetical protein
MERDNIKVIPNHDLRITEWNNETADFESYEVNDEEFELIIQHLFVHYNTDIERHKYLFRPCLHEIQSIETKEK